VPPNWVCTPKNGNQAEYEKNRQATHYSRQVACAEQKKSKIAV